ncbi:MAG: DMT family transporter [Patescibacteria group bacterium]
MNERVMGIVAGISLAFVFASMGIFARYLSTDFTLLTQIYLRVAIAFLICAVIFAHYVSWQKFLALPWREWGILTLRAISLFGGVLIFSYALIIGNYSNVSFAASVPLLPLFGYFLFKDKLSAKIIGYILLSLLGLGLITVNDWSSFSLGYPELLAVAAVVLFDISYIARKWERHTLTSLESAMVNFFISATLLFMISLAMGEGLPTLSAFSFDIVLVLIVAAVFNIFNFSLINYVFSTLTATFAGSILTLETVFALLISILLYSEIPTIIQLFGSALILVSVYKINQLT